MVEKKKVNGRVMGRGKEIVASKVAEIRLGRMRMCRVLKLENIQGMGWRSSPT